MPDHLEILLNIIGEHSIAFGDAIIVDENLNNLGMTVQYQEGMDRIPKDDIEWAKMK